MWTTNHNTILSNKNDFAILWVLFFVRTWLGWAIFWFGYLMVGLSLLHSMHFHLISSEFHNLNLSMKAKQSILGRETLKVIKGKYFPTKKFHSVIYLYTDPVTIWKGDNSLCLVSCSYVKRKLFLWILIL